MPSATYIETIRVDAPPAQVWDDLQDADLWAAIGPVQKVWDPVYEDGVLTGFLWSTEIGGAVYDGTGSATVLDRPDRYELVLDTSEMAGTITVDLIAANPGGGTEIDVSVELRSKGFLSSMFFPMVSKAVGDGLAEQVEAIAGKLSAA